MSQGQNNWSQTAFSKNSTRNNIGISVVVFCHNNKATETDDFQQSRRDFGEINHILTYRDRIILHLLCAHVHTHACIHRVAIGKGGRKGERLYVLQKGLDVMNSSIATRSLAFSLYSLSSVSHKGVISTAWNVWNSFWFWFEWTVKSCLWNYGETWKTNVRAARDDGDRVLTVV